MALVCGFQELGGSNRGGENCGLRDLGHPKFFFRTFKAQLRELVADGVISFCEGVAGLGILLREFFSHADDLGTLAGEEESDFLCLVHILVCIVIRNGFFATHEDCLDPSLRSG